jgi:hypothetical protein
MERGKKVGVEEALKGGPASGKKVRKKSAIAERSSATKSDHASENSRRNVRISPPTVLIRFQSHQLSCVHGEEVRCNKSVEGKGMKIFKKWAN